MKLIVHVGPHKTATSALQAFLNRNHAALREKGVWYRGWQGTTNHTPLATMFLHRNPAAGGLMRGYVEDAAASSCEVCVVSTEVLAKGDFDPKPLLAAIDGYRATFVAYLRAPDERMISAFDQVVRNKSRTGPIGELENFDPTYRQNLLKWAKAEGHEFVLAPYDRAQWTGGNIFEDFLSMFGIGRDGLELELDESEENRSLRPALTEVLRVANAVGLSGETRRAFIAGLYKLQASRPNWYRGDDLLTQSQSAEIRHLLWNNLDQWRPYFRPGFDPAYLAPDAKRR
ncbi:hypothetical protein [Mesorhizobium sp. J428]|uniref:hypothetical protein n=1 Tax=Mesorhizobium sp. J428 TaxID=2898440 RepID=UPI0021508030|nr:hypothetical protein [Mesorhizobium sp. J428]MCR5859746.1 hypothetical protein [Mesorhizobium sp. J428]